MRLCGSILRVFQRLSTRGHRTGVRVVSAAATDQENLNSGSPLMRDLARQDAQSVHVPYTTIYGLLPNSLTHTRHFAGQRRLYKII